MYFIMKGNKEDKCYSVATCDEELHAKIICEALSCLERCSFWYMLHL